MSYNPDVYRKVGRGGAGNYYQPKPATADDKDIEAQTPDPSTQTLEATGPTAAVPGSYTRAGRGGAGNFFDPSTAREQQNAEELATANANANAKQPVTRMALGGRGGAGNYHQKQQDQEELEAGKKMAEEMEKKVQEEVEGGLSMPPKAFLSQNRGEQKE